MPDSIASFLIVDDDQVLSQTLQRALQRRGFHPIVAHDEAGALAACEDHQFDRAVIDLKLATSSGLQLLPKLLERQPAMKIVILTGYSSIATAVDAIKLGALNYLCKPVDIDELLAAFEQVQPSVNTNTLVDAQPPSVERLEWEHIQRVLREHDGNISATARALGMHRRTLQRKLFKRPVKR